ncbi:MAG TPA: insulinase family protein [Allosphingosinicella sp.]|jgi:zinc protease
MKTYILAALLGGAALAVPISAAAAPERNLSWTHERSDLKPDPAARFGKLANGMRYVIYKNATPPGQVALRFRFDTGDLMETDAQNGLAHFMEHMAFNGTTNVKEGEILKMLERNGLMFGREVNAFTAPDQTVYILDIPAVTDAKLDTGFLMFRELASEMTFDSAAIDRERGVIVSEDRSMYPAVRRASVAKDQFLLKDQLIAQRMDIGNLDVIRKGGRELFVDYYRKYYRPERAALIVVGDVDPDKIEAEIKRRFSDWRAVGAPGAEPNLGTVAQRGFEAGSTVMEGALREVSVNWLRPFEEEPDTRAERIENRREQLANAVFNRRLQRLIESGSAPFTSGAMYTAKRYRSAEQSTVTAMPNAGRSAEAIAVLEQEVRRAGEHGILQSELDREIVEARAALQASVANAKTRTTTALANEYMTLIGNDEVLMSPAQRLELFEEAVRGYTAAQASRVLKAQFTGSGPLLYALSPDPIEGGHTALAAAYQQSGSKAVSAPVQVATKAWPFTSFGTPGKVAERTEIADLGVARVRFENGVTLLVKPTKFQEDQVMVSVAVGGGLLAQDPASASASAAALPLNQGAFVAGGLEGLTQEEMKQSLSGKQYGAAFGVGENSYGFRGGTTSGDFATQMQVLAAYVSRPGWRTEAYEQKKREFQAIYPVLATMPMNIGMLNYFPNLVRSGDLRWGLPDADVLAKADVADARKRIEPHLQTSPIEVTIVGDVTVEEAIAQTAATFGALPKRKSALPSLAGAERIKFAAGKTHRLQHDGRPDVALGLVSWPTDDFFDDPAQARALQVLRSVVSIKAMEKLREELGATYSPQAMEENSQIFDEFGQLTVLAEVNPTELERLLKTIQEVADELKAKPLAPEDLARAAQPLVDQVGKEKATNAFWAGRLSLSSWEPRRLDTIRQQEAHLKQVTPAIIQRLAQKYLRSDTAFRMLIEPKNKAAAAAKPAAK